MISERKLAHAYSSFWRGLLPMGDSYVRKLNLECERFNSPIRSKLSNDGSRRSIVNEMAFTQFTYRINEDGLLTPKVFSERELKKIADQTRRYISRLESPLGRRLLQAVSKEELMESAIIRENLVQFFNSHSSETFVTRPLFPGCGILQTCKGDVLSQTTLYEVKAGDRHFRISDIRQLLVYCGLNFASRRYSFEYICLLNPRTGLFFTGRIDDIITEMSGRDTVAFFTDFINFLSTDRVSG